MNYKAGFLLSIVSPLGWICGYISFKACVLTLFLLKSIYYYFYQTRYDLYVSESPLANKIVKQAELDSCVSSAVH